MSGFVVILPVLPAAARAALAPSLARGRPVPLANGDWRAWLTQRVGRADLAAQPPAGLAAGAFGVAREAAWFATPVALLAAHDHVRMPVTGWLALEAAEAESLATDFARVFAGSGLSLVPAGAEGFLLTGIEATAETVDPARVLGGDIAPWLPAGAGAAPLRRLGVEIEMWLHEHAVNRARTRRGADAICGLWLWGGAAHGPASSPAMASPATPVAAPARVPRGYGSDAWLRGLWSAMGRALEGPAHAFDAFELSGDLDTIAVVRDAVDGNAAARWIEPALAALAARRTRTVLVVADGRTFRFGRFDLVKPWRRRVAWAVPA
ncbi:MAG: hypothetical protein CMLOHMNK_02749 [Steroidobacteraceae bacterium]|nr:hypothetical protein [Steroidobacteraceae bacterium]